MTREEHQALDAALAEQVMGWRKVRLECAYGAERLRGLPESDSYSRRSNVPAYSSDMAEAWQVVERLQAEGWLYELGADETEPSEHYAIFRLPTVDPLHEEYADAVSASGESPAVAVCRAALAWAKRRASE